MTRVCGDGGMLWVDGLRWSLYQLVLFTSWMRGGEGEPRTQINIQSQELVCHPVRSSNGFTNAGMIAATCC